MKPTCCDSPETWVPIPGMDGYRVSDHGRVQGPTGTILRPHVNAKGYHRVGVRRGGSKLVHTHVLAAFVGPRPDGMQTRHLDGNPANNHLANLVWGTPSENRYDTVRQGRHPMTARTHCPQGHEFTPENTRSRNGAGHRQCRTCQNLASKAWRDNQRGKPPVTPDPTPLIQQDGSTFVNTAQAAAIVGVKPSTIRRWIMKGWIQAAKIPGHRTNYYRLADVIACERDHRTSAKRKRIQTAARRYADTLADA